MNIKVNEIEINEGRRKVDFEKVTEIANSIKEIGLINPITVKEKDSGYLLIAGMHRLEAFKELGKEEIPVHVMEGTKLELELIEIDENLVRNELFFLELDDLTLRRKQIYEEMYPETKVGGDRKSKKIKTTPCRSDKPTFAKDTAEKTGESERNIQRRTQRAENLIPEAKKIIKERGFTQTDATSLSRKEPKEQKQIVDMIVSKKSNTIKEAEETIKPKNVHVSNNSGNNEWYTPIRFLEIARKVMGSIDTDPASSEIANKNVKAKTFYTQETNGLEQDWVGNVWMNPPYAQPLIQQFADKLIAEIDNGNTKQAMVLVNNATETKWFNTLSKKASGIWFVPSRIKFIDVTGKPSGAPLQGQAMLYFGDNFDTFRNNCEGLVCRCSYE